MSVRSLTATVQKAAHDHRTPANFPQLPSPEILFTVFVFVTTFAVSPVGQQVDKFFDFELITTPENGAVYDVMSEVLDRISSQRVAGMALLLTALALAWLVRSLAPLIIAGLAELAFLATGVLKVLIAKNSTTVGAPDHWENGILAHGKHSMAYPSGHAMESVALYGAILLLLVMYLPGWTQRHTRVSVRVWHLIIIQTSLVSWLLGRHWVSDLVGGVLWGMLSMAILVGLVERGYPQALASALNDWIARARASAADPPPPTRLHESEIHPVGPLR